MAVVRLMIIGDAGVGKSILVKEATTVISKATIEAVELPDLETGDENLGYFQGAVLVYDLTRGETLQSLVKWLEDLKQDRPPMILVANNQDDFDLEQSSDVLIQEGLRVAEKYGLLFATCSTDVVTINEMFLRISKDVLGEMDAQEEPAQEEPVQEPPAQEPPVQEAPVQEPPAQEEPVQEPPVQEQAQQEEVPIPETARERKAREKATKKQEKDEKTAEAKARVAAMRATEELLGIPSSSKPKPKKSDKPKKERDYKMFGF